MSDDNESMSVTKPLINFALAGGYTFMNKPGVNLVLGSTRIPYWVMVGGATAVSSWLADLAHDSIFPHIFRDDKTSDTTAFLANAGMVGGANLGVTFMLDQSLSKLSGRTSNILSSEGANVVAVPVISSMVGTYIYEHLVKSYVE